MTVNLQTCLQAWQTLLGDEHVVVDEEKLQAIQTATYATTQRVPAIIRPGNRPGVQECVKIANQYHMPIYPISAEKNWGYGSRVPVRDGCVILDLGCLNRIVDYNEKLAYVSVEPGVTQEQLFEFLQQQQSMWLMPKPKFYQFFWYILEQDAQLEVLIENLRELRLTDVLKTTFVLTNDYRTISMRSQYPWAEAQGQTPLPDALRRKLRADAGSWFGEGALYSADEKQSEVERQLIQQAIEASGAAFYYYNEELATFSNNQLQVLFPTVDFDQVDRDQVDQWYRENFNRGYPNDSSIKMTYWRKKQDWPAQMAPDRDQCGLFWVVPSLPFEAIAVREAVSIVEKIALAYQYEPSIGLNCVSARHIDMTAAIVYDREQGGEDERALTCFDEMMKQLMQAGYYPYRLNTHLMETLPTPDDDYNKVIDVLKRALDPNNILAPGRYDFR
ncbi:hypothetical protein C2W62_16505 [Candidatus Entotheonella serta]|nr:hypothetical protein C2W62_16505 [Candidatus Entotheonella serta]